MADWESQIAGERMAVDGEFSDRVTASSLDSQQWNLVMTAVQFDIDHPERPDEATLVADTSRLDSVMGDVERVGDQSRMAASGSEESSGDGILGGVLSSLGLGGAGSSNEQLRAAATELAEEYAGRLQEKLEEKGRWTTICERAASD